jgi:hypothetical protein
LHAATLFTLPKKTGQAVSERTKRSQREIKEKDKKPVALNWGKK